MLRFNIHRLLAAVALGVVATAASAADPPAQRLGRYRAEDDNIVIRPQAKDEADDTEKIRHRAYFGPSFHYGYRPYFGGYSYGFATSYYAPRFYAPPVYYYTPRYYYAPPVFYSQSFYHNGFCGISGTPGSEVTMSLMLRPRTGRDATPNAASPAMPSATAPGTFRYDGDPAPVPKPMPNANPNPMPQAEEPPPMILAPRPSDDSLKISLRRNVEPTQPLRFKAYGEK